MEGFFIDKDPVRSVDLTTSDAITKGMKEPGMIVEAVKRKAEELADDGADVIEIGCGLFGPICTMAGLTSLKDGRVPLLDPMLVGFKIAEIVVTISQTLGIPFRRGLSCYERISKEEFDNIRKSYNLPLI